MSAASELSGWLLCSTSSAAAARSLVGQAVTAPNATTRRARTAPMTRSRPGSVVAAARSRSTPSANAVRRGAGAGAGTGAGAVAGRGGAALLDGGCVTVDLPHGHLSPTSITAGTDNPQRGAALSPPRAHEYA